MISVCMATFNGEHFIKQQIDSILCQLDQEDELIISDDGSTDKTLSLIQLYNDKRIKIYHHIQDEENLKTKTGKSFYLATSNFENALKHATGEFIFLSDQDDIWMPKKKQKILSLLKSYDCIVHNYQIIDKNNQVIKEKQFSKNPIRKSIIGNILDNHYRGCCLCFKKKYLDHILPIPKNVIGHDYWIGTLISYYGNTYYDMESLIQSRWYPESVSSKKKTRLVYKLSYRFNLLKEVLIRIWNNKI